LGSGREQIEITMTEEMSPEESERHSFLTFHHGVLLLSLPAEEASNANGNYNTAWELKDGIANHPTSYLANAAFLDLSTAQLDVIETLTKMVAAIPEDAVSPKGINTRAVEGDIASLKHPAWSPVRAFAAEVIKILQPVAIRNKAYFEEPRL
jgi:hypothetical protein